jgi:hypothetical protein
MVIVMLDTTHPYDMQGPDLSGITRPSKFNIIALSTSHIAVIRRKPSDYYGAVLVYDLKGNLSHQLKLDPKDFVASTPDGRIATCDKTGKITLHKIFPERVADHTCSIL